MKLAAAGFSALLAALCMFSGCHEKDPSGPTSSDFPLPPLGMIFSIPTGELTFFRAENLEALGSFDLSDWAVTCAVVNQQGDRLLVIDDDSPRIGVFQLPGLTLLAATPIGGFPVDLQVAPSGMHAYVLTRNSNFWIYSINGQQLDTLETGVEPRRFALRPPHTTEGWVACAGSMAIFVYDLATFQPSDTIPVDAQPTAVTFSPNGDFAYVALRGTTGVIQIFDATNRTSIGFMDAGDGPFDLAMSNSGRYLAASDSVRANVRIWDIEQAQHWDVAVGGAPARLRYSEQQRSFYVCSRAVNRVYRIDVAGDVPFVAETIDAIPNAREIALWELPQ